jgi:hypothetical protein
MLLMPLLILGVVFLQNAFHPGPSVAFDETRALTSHVELLALLKIHNNN